MRYFLFLALSEVLLTPGIINPTLSAGLIQTAGSLLRYAPGLIGTICAAILVAPVTVTANNDLAMAAITIEDSGSHIHRQKADECWI